MLDDGRMQRNGIFWRLGDGRKQHNGRAEFVYLSTALSAAGKRLCTLSVGSVDNTEDIYFKKPARRTGLPSIFNAGATSPETHHTYVNAYQALKNLTLHVACGVRDAPSLYWFNNLCNLGRLLKSIPNLEYLELVLPHASKFNVRPYTYERLFESKDGRWPRLHTLVLKEIGFGTKDLIEFLCNCLPSLRNLRIAGVMLCDGRWEWIIEAMRRSLSLERFETSHYEKIFLHVDDDFTGGNEFHWDQPAKCKWDLDITRDYVLRRPGVLHPNLQHYKRDEDGEDDEDAAARNAEAGCVSQQYFDELQNFLLRSGQTPSQR